jgi:hypothetical protein
MKLRTNVNMVTKFLTITVLSLSLMGSAGIADAGQRGGGSRSGGGGGRAVARSGGVTTGRAVPRPGRSYYRPSYGRPYYYGGYRGYYGYPYGGYYPYGLGFSFGYGYPYGYGYGYGYPYGYGYGYPYGYCYVGGGYLGSSYGGLRISDAPRDAAVYADGYYVGTVDDFDGTFQHLNLENGAHHIEIAPQGQPRIAFDVNIRPGQTITYRADR